MKSYFKVRLSENLLALDKLSISHMTNLTERLRLRNGTLVDAVFQDTIQISIDSSVTNAWNGYTAYEKAFLHNATFFQRTLTFIVCVISDMILRHPLLPLLVSVNSNIGDYDCHLLETQDIIKFFNRHIRGMFLLTIIVKLYKITIM